MNIKIMPKSTAKDSYRDEERRKEIQAFLETFDVQAGDIVNYNGEYPLTLLRSEFENKRFDIEYCGSELDAQGKYQFKVVDRKYLVEPEGCTEMTTLEDFESLNVGDKIYKVTSDRCRGLRLVGRMPGSHNYLILSDGEHLEHLYLPNFKNYRWFQGYDSKTIGQVMLENLEKRVGSVNRIYIEDED